MTSHVVTVSASHGGQRFLPATRNHPAWCPRIPQRSFRCIRPASSGGFHSDPVGASTDATAAPAHLATPSDRLPPSNGLMLYFNSVFGHLRGHASSLVQHLSSPEHAAFLHSLGHDLGAHVRMPGAGGVPKGNGESTGVVFEPLSLLHQVPRFRPLNFDSTPKPLRQQDELQGLQQHVHNTNSGHLWITSVLSHVPLGIFQRTSTSHAGAATSDSSDRTAAQQPGPAEGSDSNLRHHSLAVYSPGLVILWWHSALVLQQRAVVTALWHMGHVVEAAHKARRNMPPPAEVPGLVHWGAVAAVARAEETVVLALARTAVATSEATAGLPSAAVAITGSAAAGAATATVTAPHLPLLRHARRRLLAAATPTLERLRGLQRGCTTHVLLRFLLFSAINPRLRRDLWVRLDVLARRAAQVALLHEQHDAWLVRQLPTSSPSALSVLPSEAAPMSNTAEGGGANLAAPSQGLEVARPSLSASSSSLLPPAGSISGVSILSSSAPLSARWYRRVFAPEMLACMRQLRVDAPGSPPDDKTAGDPPGRFDLRDLYRLIRVIEVAVEDLERYGS